ncbi:hypothetical protein ACEQ8H_006559 [Pleosporales sp. CAS-2024a]
MPSIPRNVSSLLVLGLLTPSITAAPTNARPESEDVTVQKDNVVRRSANTLLNTCGLCPAIQRLAVALPENLNAPAQQINNGLTDLIKALDPNTLASLLNGLPNSALAPLWALNNGTELPGLPTGIPSVPPSALSALPTDAAGGIIPSGISGLPSALPTNSLGGIIPSGIPTSVLKGLPSGVPGSLGGASGLPGGLASALPTNALGNLVLPSNLPSNIAQALTSGLPTDSLGGIVPSSLPTNVLGALSSLAAVLPSGLKPSGLPVTPSLPALPSNGLASLPKSLPGGVPTDILGGVIRSGLPSDVLASLPSSLPTNILGNLVPSGLPSNILSNFIPTGLPTGPPSVPGVSGLPGLPSGLASIPTDVLGGIIPSGLPSNVLALLPTGLPTNALGNLIPSGLPSNVLQGLAPSRLPTGAPSLPVAWPTDILGGLITSGLPTNVLGSLPTGLPTNVLGNLIPSGVPSSVLAELLQPSLLGGSPAGSKLPTALPTGILNSLLSELPTRSLSDLIASALPSNVPSNVLGALSSAIPSALPSGLPGALSGLPGALSGLPSALSGLPSALPSGLPGVLSGLPGALPSGLPGALSGLPSALPSGLPAALSGLPSALPTGLPSALPTGLLSALPITLPSGLPNGLPSGLPTGVLQGLSNALPSGLPTNPLNAVSGLPTNAISGLLASGLPTNALSGVPALPTGILGSTPNLVNGLASTAGLGPVANNPLGGLFGGVATPVANNPAGSLVSGIRTPTLTTPASALPTGILGQGTVYDRSFTYIFYYSGIVQINTSYLQPKRGIFAGYLAGQVLAGTFLDGLHIGNHLIPYPPGFLASNPHSKPSGPPPIRHKARQKAIHNARRGRGNARAGGRGGGPSRNQASGNGIDTNADFVSFSSNSNNFSVLNGHGSRHHLIALDDDDSLEDDATTGSDADSDLGSADGSEDSAMEDAGSLTINVDTRQGQRGRPGRATVMFSLREALNVYKGLSREGFPLTRSKFVRYGLQASETMLFIEDLHPSRNICLPQLPQAAPTEDATARAPLTDSSRSSVVGPLSSSVSRQQSTSTSTTAASVGSAAKSSLDSNARDYIFDWGAHSGKHFSQVPESYLKTIGRNPGLLEKHPGTREAFDYHRPGMRRAAPKAQSEPRRTGKPVQAVSQGPTQGSRGDARKARKSWTTFTFPSGAHATKKLNEVPENYLRTIEGMAHVVNKWAGLKDALLDYNAKTGRKHRIAS